ncbi:holin [bacterium]|nr:holin [bacterium]
MNSHESAGTIAAKAAPPVSVSIASVAGYQISEILLWATLVYTLIMIGHKLYQIYKEFKK